MRLRPVGRPGGGTSVDRLIVTSRALRARRTVECPPFGSPLAPALYRSLPDQRRIHEFDVRTSNHRFNRRR